MPGEGGPPCVWPRAASLLEVPSLAFYPLPLHTPFKAIPGALPCTREGFSPPRGEAGNPLCIQLPEPRLWSPSRKGVMGKSQSSEKLPVGVDDPAAFTRGPFPLPPLCLIMGTPGRKRGLFWPTLSSQEALPFTVSSLYFLSLL